MINQKSLVTAGHCGREVWDKGMRVWTVDEKGYPLYTAVAYQGSKSKGIWNLKWVPPPGLKPPYASAIDIAVWESTDRPFPAQLALGDLSQHKAGDMLYAVHIPWYSSQPSLTEGWLIYGSGTNLTQATGNLGAITFGSSGGIITDGSGVGLAILNRPVPRPSPTFRLYGVEEDRGVKGLVSSTSIAEGLRELGYLGN